MEHEHKPSANSQKKHNHYKRLALMAVLSFACMYILMYAMVNSISNVYPNINQLYMAALMTMPMIIIEVVVMSVMYKNRKLNAVIIGASAVGLVVFILFIQAQAAVSDKQFIKSMIPHHASAILMSKKANIHDPEIKKLTEGIITNQQREIDQMKEILKRLK